MDRSAAAVTARADFMGVLLRSITQSNACFDAPPRLRVPEIRGVPGRVPPSGCRIVEMLPFLLVLLQGEPTTLDGWAAKARERYVNGFTTESVNAWTKAIEINKERAEFYVGRARARRQGND